MAAGCKIVFNKIPALVGATDEIKGKALRALAFAIQEEAQVLAPRDTSALANALYTDTDQGSTRDQAIAAARSLNPSGGIATEVQIEKGQAKVADAMEYAPYVELGTRHMGAQPYLTPAVHQIEGEAEAIAGRVVADEIKRVL